MPAEEPVQAPPFVDGFAHPIPGFVLARSSRYAWDMNYLVNRQIEPLRTRVWRMILLWIGFGAVVGVSSSPSDGGIGDKIAGAVAGMMVLPWLGLALGLVGGRWKEALLGAMCGAGCGIAGGIVIGPANVALAVSICLLIGGLAGATFPIMSRVQSRVASRITGWLCRSAVQEPINP
jgi:hypothetical protein